MSPQTKLALRRVAIRWARKLLDFLDDRLHAEEVRLREDAATRNDLCARKSAGPSVAGKLTANPERRAAFPGRAQTETFTEWEARRSGVAVISKKEARRRQRPTASVFDLRFSQ
jgi:hypothetical protein